MSAEIEHLSTTSAFRFGAAGAYEAIVNQRIQVLREERIGGRQLFAEFMMRRFDPAMRTCRSAKERLAELSARAERAANLLRTRVDVANQAQNVEVLRGDGPPRGDAAPAAGDGRGAVGGGDQLLRGQPRRRAASGRSPSRRGLGKAELLALLTLPVVVLVWWMVRRIRARLGHRAGPGHRG